MHPCNLMFLIYMIDYLLFNICIDVDQNHVNMTNVFIVIIIFYLHIYIYIHLFIYLMLIFTNIYILYKL